MGPESGFDEALSEELRDLDGVKSAVPMVETRAWFTSRDGQPRSLAILGIDLLQEAAVRSYESRGQDVIDDPLVFLNTPDSIVLTTRFAAEHGMQLDSRFKLSTAYGDREFVVRGLLEPEGPAKAYGGALAIMDIDGARYSFGKEGKVDRIDIVVDKGADLVAVTRRLQERLGPAYRVERPDAQAESLGKMVESYQALLGFFSLLALLVGIFLVANAVSVAVAERRREIGTLRALGATRLSIVSVFLGEALAVGLIGAAAGILFGRALAGGPVASVARSMSVQFVTPIQVSDVRLDAAQVCTGIAIGAVAALVAALVPAIRTTQVHPIEALRPPVFDDQAGAGRWSRIFRLAGVGMLVVLLVSSRLGLAGKVALFEALDPLFAIAGALLAGPWFVAASVRALRWSLGVAGGKTSHAPPPFALSVAPDAQAAGAESKGSSISGAPLDSASRVPREATLGVTGGAAQPAPARAAAAATVLRLACDNLLRNPRRTGSNVMSLMVGLMLVVVLSTMSASFKDSVSGWFARILQWDLLVSAAGNLAATTVQPLHEEVARELAAVEGVESNTDGTLFAMRFSRTGYAGKQIGLKAFGRARPSSSGSST
ncbi:MAG: FtsX-like permease family protein [Myxococcales bacterium]